jgi:hypothetical protein
LRKFERNFFRELDISVLIEPAHRMIIDCLRTAVLNGLKMTFVIKSKLFKFYLPLIQTASCIFSYSNGLNSDEEIRHCIDISRDSNQEEFGVEKIEKCSYKKYHDYIDLACTGSLKTAIDMSSKGCAVQLDCSDISSDNIIEPLIVLDFYNQNCKAFNSEFPCISLVGNNGLHRCLGKKLGIFI